MTKKSNLPLVSIIVPVYNVELYLVKCLDSIVQQTYKNIEIIVVNDGSTDNSATICESYKKKDSRIKLIHQSNQGLSVARNKGIENCTGEYLMFVDSDDWISKSTISVLLADIQKYNLKLSMCDYLKVTNEDMLEGFKQYKPVVTIYNKEDAIKKMLQGSWWSACMKLYHKSIFKNLRFPVGRNNEDYAIMIYVFEQCERISFNTSNLYFYLTRQDSICTSNLNIRKFDEVYNTLDVLEYVKIKYPQFKNEAEFNLGASLIKLIFEIYRDKSETFIYMLPKMKTILYEHYKSLIKNDIMPLQQKLFIYIIKNFNKRFNYCFYKTYLFYKGIKLRK